MHPHSRNLKKLIIKVTDLLEKFKKNSDCMGSEEKNNVRKS